MKNFIVKLPNKFYMALKKPFYLKENRSDRIILIDPKKRDVSFNFSSNEPYIDCLTIHRGMGCSYISLDDYGKRWSFDKNDLLKEDSNKKGVVE